MSEKIALVTGGAKRLGAAISRRLAKEGFNLAIHSHRSSSEAVALIDELESYRISTRSFSADFSRTDEIVTLYENVKRWGGKIDLCVNNASLFLKDAPGSFDHLLFESSARVNSLAPILLAELIHADAILGVSDALVVNMLDSKVGAPNPNFFSYTLSKIMLDNATTLQAKAYAGRPRVCGIAPGLVIPSTRQSKENFEMSSRLNPLKISVDHSDVSDAVMFLWRTKGINGQVIYVDGGHALMQLDFDPPSFFSVGGEIIDDDG